MGISLNLPNAEVLLNVWITAGFATILRRRFTPFCDEFPPFLHHRGPHQHQNGEAPKCSSTQPLRETLRH